MRTQKYLVLILFSLWTGIFVLGGCASIVPTMKQPNSLSKGYEWIPRTQAYAAPIPYPFQKVDAQLPREAAVRLYEIFEITDTNSARADWLWNQRSDVGIGNLVYSDNCLNGYFRDSGTPDLADDYDRGLNIGFWSRVGLGATGIVALTLIGANSNPNSQQIVEWASVVPTFGCLAGMIWSDVVKNQAIQNFDGRLGANLGLGGQVPGQVGEFALARRSNSTGPAEGNAPCPTDPNPFTSVAEKHAWYSRYKLTLVPFSVGGVQYVSAETPALYLARCGQLALAAQCLDDQWIWDIGCVACLLGGLGVTISSLGAFDPSQASNLPPYQEVFWTSLAAGTLGFGTAFYAAHDLTVGVEIPYNAALRVKAGLAF